MTPVFPRNNSGALGTENVLQNAKTLRYLGNPGTVKKNRKLESFVSSSSSSWSGWGFLFVL